MAPRVVLLGSGGTFRRRGLGEDFRSLVTLRQKNRMESESKNSYTKAVRLTYKRNQLIGIGGRADETCREPGI